MLHTKTNASVLVAGTSPTAMLGIKPLVPKLKNPSSWIFLNAFHLQPPEATKTLFSRITDSLTNFFAKVRKVRY